MKNYFLIPSMLILNALISKGQFNTYNQASLLANGAYQLTPALNGQKGSVWYGIGQDLTRSFEVSGQLYFGNKEAGADGITFVMQNNCVGGGTSGGGIGYGGLQGKNLGIEFDTYQNSTSSTGNLNNGDPSFDHIGIQKNGTVNHNHLTNSLVAPVQMHNTKQNVEDGIWYDYRIVWDAVSNKIEVYFDGVLRVSYSINLHLDVFGGDKVVYWGFTSSTGGSYADNSVKINSMKHFGIPDKYMCFGDTVRDISLPILSQKEKISEGKPVFASSEEGLFISENVTDADVTSRWSSTFSDKQDVYVDLEDAYSIDSVNITWETAAGKKYEIQTSLDGISWTKVASIDNGVKDEKRAIKFPSITARYVKMQGIERTTLYGYSIYDFQIFGVGKYSWATTTYISDISISTPKLYPPITSIYEVKVPDRCNGPTIVPFTVFVDTISLSLASKSTVCENDTIIIIPTVKGAFGLSAIDWTPNTSISPTSTYKLFPAIANTYKAMVIDSLGCKDSADVTIVLDKLPSKAIVANKDSICQNTHVISATRPLIGTGQWRNVSAAASSIATPLSETSNVSGLNEGGTKIEWSVSNGVCLPSKDTIEIIRVPDLSKSEAGLAQNICADTATLNALVPVVGSGTWTSKNILPTRALNPSNSKSKVENLVSGQNYFYWTVSDVVNKVCPPNTDSVLITRQVVLNADIPSLSLSKDSICTGENVTVTQSVKKTNIRWYSSFDNLVWSPILTASDYFINRTPNQTTFYTTLVDIDNCLNLVKDTIKVNVSNMPLAGNLVGSASEICEKDSVFFTLSGHSGSINWQDSTGLAAWNTKSAESNKISIRTKLDAFTAYRVIVSDTDKICPNDTSNIARVITEDSVKATLVSATTPVCEGIEWAVTMATNSNNYVWQKNTNGIIWSPLTETSLTLKEIGTDTVKVRLVALGVKCPNYTLSQTINVAPKVIVPEIEAPNVICVSTQAKINLKNGAYNTIIWQDSSDALGWKNINLETKDTLMKVLAVETRFRALVSRNSVCPSEYTKDTTVSITNLPINPVILLNKNQFCDGEEAQLSIVKNGTLPQVWQKSINSGPWLDITSSNTGGYEENIQYVQNLNEVSYRAINKASCGGDGISTPQDLTVYPVPMGSIGSLTLCEEEEKTINFTTSNNASVVTWQSSEDSLVWSIVSSNPQQLNHKITKNTFFKAVYGNGTTYNCQKISNVISLSKCKKIVPLKAPNTITVNGDGINETFRIQGIETYNATVYIYNRWGQIVFESDNYSNEEWDGNNLPESVYYYVIKFKDDKSKQFSGVVHLLR